jgi:hypothetical protein
MKLGRKKNADLNEPVGIDVIIKGMMRRGYSEAEARESLYRLIDIGAATVQRGKR